MTSHQYLLPLLLSLLLAGCSTISPPNVTSKAGYHIPQTDCEVRDWYNYQVVAIPAINKRWIKTGMSAAERAKRAFDIRHRARINARFMMPDQVEVKALQARDKAKYGNPDGPTFAYLVKKLQDKGMKGDAVYESIVASSSHTSSKYNAACAKP